MEIKLKYGCNSHQAPAHLIVPDNSGFQVLNGTPSYINSGRVSPIKRLLSTAKTSPTHEN